MRLILDKYRARLGRVYFRLRGMLHREMEKPTFPPAIQRMIRTSPDRIRYTAMALALERIRQDHVPGALAEIGVYHGVSSRLLHAQMPERPFYLFDTFSGFPNDDADQRFQNTSVEAVKARLGDLQNVVFRIGVFPHTACGLENELFSFVLYDADKYEPTKAALEFFYPRLSPGGYFIFHDYNCSESDGAVKKAADEFMHRKPESLIELPDICGSALFRKSRQT